MAARRTPFSTILVATDFSERSDAGVALAGTLAAHEDARLVLLHVVELPEGVDPEASITTQSGTRTSVENDTRREALGAMDEQVKRVVPGGVSVTQCVAFGSAAEEIVRAAGEDDVDLVVVSSHGRRGLARIFLGSVAEEVLRRSPVPVLTVRPPAHAGDRGGTDAERALVDETAG